MTWPGQDLADAFFALLSNAPGLTVFDGSVTEDSLVGGGVFSPEPPYTLVYFYIETPSGLVAPEAVSLVLDSTAIDGWAYVHSVGVEPQAARSARAVAGQGRAALVDQKLTVPGRTCFPIRWDSGRPPAKNEETGRVVFDQVDVYRFRSVPA